MIIIQKILRKGSLKMTDILEKMKGFMKNSVDIDFKFGESVPCGGSKFGGRPDVPEGFEWTVFDDMPLSFIAQFDLSEVSAYDKDGLLPKEGVLSFFYEIDSMGMDWGFDPKTEGCARVFYFPPEAKLSPAPFPEELEEEYRLPEAKAVMSSKMFYPDPCDDTEEYGLTEEEEDEYFDAYDEISDELPGRISKLLGHPNLIQDSIPLECELVSRGIYTGSGYPEITEEMKEAAKEWVLVFQLDSFDDECNLMFGDDGRIYWYIKKSDLANKRFDKAHLVLQCY